MVEMGEPRSLRGKNETVLWCCRNERKIRMEGRILGERSNDVCHRRSNSTRPRKAPAFKRRSSRFEGRPNVQLHKDNSTTFAQTNHTNDIGRCIGQWSQVTGP